MRCCEVFWFHKADSLFILARTAFEKMTDVDYLGETYYTIRNLSLYECQVRAWSDHTCLFVATFGWKSLVCIVLYKIQVWLQGYQSELFRPKIETFGFFIKMLTKKCLMCDFFSRRAGVEKRLSAKQPASVSWPIHRGNRRPCVYCKTAPRPTIPQQSPFGLSINTIWWKWALDQVRIALFVRKIIQKVMPIFYSLWLQCNMFS